MKKPFTVKVSEDDMVLIDHITNNSSVTRASILEFTLSVLRGYFTEEQLLIEAGSFSPVDGRRVQRKESVSSPPAKKNVHKSNKKELTLKARS